MTRLLKPFSRITTSGRTFLPQIDGLRFVAIMAVIAYHVLAITSFHYGVVQADFERSGNFIGELFGSGSLGVQLFFSISGFILVLPFAKHHLKLGGSVKLRSYFIRRLTRLEPPYIIQLLMLFVLCCTLYRHTPSRPEFYHNTGWFTYTWQHLTASLFYCNGFIFKTHPMPNIVLWSLEVEVQFYLLAPLLAQVFKLTNTGVRRAVITSLIFLVPIINHASISGYLSTCSLAGNLQYFLAGFLLCDLYLTRWSGDPARTWRWDFLFAAAVLSIVWHQHISYFIWLLPWLCLAMGMAAFRGIATGWFLGNPWIATIGGMCYTIYMYHWLMISALMRATVNLHAHAYWLTLIIQFLIMAPVIVAICAILFALFERPFMQRDWPARLWAVLSRQKISSTIGQQG